MKFNEESRVKISTILNLMRLGYQYLSLKAAWIINKKNQNHVGITTVILKLLKLKKVNFRKRKINGIGCKGENRLVAYLMFLQYILSSLFYTT